VSLSEDHRKAVTAAIPSDVVVPPKFWPDLEAAIDVFCALKDHRTKRPPPSERKRWSRIEKLVDKLAGELRVIKRRTTYETLWPNQALLALWEIKRIAEAGCVATEMLSVPFKGRRDPHRAHLFAAVLDLWVLQLGRTLSYSRSQNGQPGGPLIRFFKACLDPVLDGDKPPTAHTIASIIDRERRRRSRDRRRRGRH
jgi:hypothetical protein